MSRVQTGPWRCGVSVGGLGKMLLSYVLRTVPTSSSSQQGDCRGQGTPPTHADASSQAVGTSPHPAHPRVSMPAQLCSEAVEMSGFVASDQCPHPPPPRALGRRPWRSPGWVGAVGGSSRVHIPVPSSGPGPHPSPASRQAVCSLRPAQQHRVWSWGPPCSRRLPLPRPPILRRSRPGGCGLRAVSWNTASGPAGLRA